MTAVPALTEREIEALRSGQFPVTRELTWLDTARYGPLPSCNVEAQTGFLEGMSLGRRFPGVGHWWEAANSIRGRVGELLNCNWDDVAFLKSTGEGVNLVALGLDWEPGDEVVTYDLEFPSVVYPWLALQRKGVNVRFVQDQGRFRFDPEDVEALIGPRTRVVCLSLVNFNSGFRAPIEAISHICRQRGVWLVVDAVQATGALKVDVESLGADLVSAHGYKSLCSGFGISICYVAPALRDALDVVGPGWKSIEDVTDVTRMLDYNLDYPASARRFEPSVGNISGMYGLGASVGLFLEIGVDKINDHVLSMSKAVAARLNDSGYRVVSSRRPGEISGIVSAETRGHDARTVAAALEEAQVVCSVREGRLRVSSHVFNDEADLERLMTALPA